ncbi:MAG: type VI secretion system baseplate subunit TssE [Ectothiorhodospiraceae bacterium]|nr:type VI secretion system baseplate subunit TssE [Ectothiorhodospiraceae bacterium]MCH8503529.1 type VI secretion system baseplate subunit TssE [Ectothiorhodospiraceae bacterium]
MPELSSKETLQPSLLDRLTDHARFRERVTLEYRVQAMGQAGLDVGQVRDMLGSLGLIRVESGDDGGGDVWDNRPEQLSFRSVLDLRPTPKAPPLAQLVELKSRQLVPNREESREDRVISSRRLRQMVLRDLAWLLNTGCMAVAVPLDDYPHVGRSVLNYGVPDMTGVSLSGADLSAIADGIRRAIEQFEPRVRHASVTPLERDEGGRLNTVTFLIEGELWGQPLPEQLYLHTELDLEDASMVVREAGNG